MSVSIKGWKNIPIFAVITKSLVEKDIPENIKAVQNAFAKEKSTNLKSIIPIVAKEYQVNDTIVSPFGLERLCNETLDCFEEAKSISKENRDSMILNQKRFLSQRIIGVASTAAVTVALVPLPSLITDSTLLVPIEVKMTKDIFRVYGIKYSEGIIDKIIGGAAITIIAKQIVQAIPLVGIVANVVVAGSVVATLGEGIVAASEAIYTGKIPQEDLDRITDTINDKIEHNKIVGVVAKYFEKNKDNLANKKPKEIFDEIMNTTKKK